MSAKRIHGRQIFWILSHLKMPLFYPNWFIDWLWKFRVKITFPKSFESIILLYSNTHVTDETSDTSLILHPFKEIFLSENFLSASEIILNFIGMYWGGIFSHLLQHMKILHSALGNFLSLFSSCLLSSLCFSFLGLLLVWFLTLQIYRVLFFRFWWFCLSLLDVIGVLVFSNHW